MNVSSQQFTIFEDQKDYFSGKFKLRNDRYSDNENYIPSDGSDFGVSTVPVDKQYDIIKKHYDKIYNRLK